MAQNLELEEVGEKIPDSHIHADNATEFKRCLKAYERSESN